MTNVSKKAPSVGYHAEIGFKADKTSYCVLIVNPSNPEQNGEKLRATIKAIRKDFLKCYIYVADTLDACFSGTTAIARKRGTDWIKNHSDILGDYKNDLVRWDDIREHPSFKARLENVKLVRDFNKEGRQVIHMACAHYAVKMIQNLQEKGRSYDEKVLMHKMVGYAMEEIAGLAVIRELTPYPEIYADERYGDPYVFSRLNASYIDMDLTIPAVYPLRFLEMDVSVKDSGAVKKAKAASAA